MNELNEEAFFHLDKVEYKNYIPVPYDLLSAKEFREISSDAKLLYGLILNRISVSNKNRMADNPQNE